MAINPDFLGRTFTGDSPFVVGREHIRQFAEAIGDTNPMYHDVDAAKAAGYSDLVAPPTFLTAVALRRKTVDVHDPELNLNYDLVVHGEQRYRLERPVVAGDELVVTATISAIRVAGRNEIISTTYEFQTTAGESVGTAVSTLVSRGTAAGKD
ncbi:MAG: FAS1-like dehydratase domain-containing protein [Frankia sp.]